VTGGPLALGNPMAAALPDTARVNAARQGIVGKDYIPQTIPGQYVRTAGQFAPAAILPGSIAQRATNVLLPAITSETAGQVTKGTPYEEAARFVGGLVGGVRAPGAAATVESLPGLPGRMAARSIVDPTAVQVLKNAGVKLTPGQQLGGIAKNVEDLGMRAPILGPAISGARQRGNVSLNRAVANDALSDIGETVPANVATGHDSTAFVAERLGKVYDRAADMVPSVAPDAEFNVGLNEIDKHVGELPTDVGAQYRTILQNRLFSRLGNGPVTGAQLRQIQSEIGTIAAERAASGDGAQQALGHMLEGVSDNLKGLLGRANPEAGALIQQANSRLVEVRPPAERHRQDPVRHLHARPTGDGGADHGQERRQGQRGEGASGPARPVQGGLDGHAGPVRQPRHGQRARARRDDGRRYDGPRTDRGHGRGTWSRCDALRPHGPQHQQGGSAHRADDRADRQGASAA
jgi:hypothetical protein